MLVNNAGTTKFVDHANLEGYNEKKKKKKDLSQYHRRLSNGPTVSEQMKN